MKRKTVIQYFEVICASLLVMIAVSIYTVFDYMNKPTHKSVTAGSTVDISDITVIIDAGHGGEDGGAVGINGTLEKNINLKIANKLYGYFGLIDIKAVMTRTDDRLLYYEGQEKNKKRNDINNRILLVQEYTNPIFVSIHQNKFPLEKYKGLQVYYSVNNPQSKIMASAIQDNTARYLQKDNKRQIKPAGRNILLLHRLQCPSVLVECGFLSNSDEEKLLNDEEYQKKIAFLIYLSVVESLLKT